MFRFENNHQPKETRAIKGYFLFSFSFCILLNSTSFAIEGWKGDCDALLKNLKTGILTAPMEASFIHKILLEPDNDLHREVYADWLEEQGNELATVIRYGIALKNEVLGSAERKKIINERDNLLRKWISKIHAQGGIPNFMEHYLALMPGSDPRTAEFIQIPTLDYPARLYIPDTQIQSTHLSKLFSFLLLEKNQNFQIPDESANNPLILRSSTELERALSNLNALDRNHQYRVIRRDEWHRAANYLITDNPMGGHEVQPSGPYTPEHAWYASNSDDTIHPIGSRKPTGPGFYDLFGNVNDLVLPHPHLGVYYSIGGDYHSGPSNSAMQFSWPNANHATGLRLQRFPREHNEQANQ